MGKSEFEIVKEFSDKLGLVNKTDGSLVIYKAKGMCTKPDGYYYYKGITFILDAKAEGKPFCNQLKDYMKLEKNPNFIGFEYNGTTSSCYIKGVKESTESTVQDKEYYKSKYFPNIITNNQNIVSSCAKNLADIFRNANIDKQMNVPFIGAVMLCCRYGYIESLDYTSTNNILMSIKNAIQNIIPDNQSNINKKSKREFIKLCLDDTSLKNAKHSDLIDIMDEIVTIYNFINISLEDNIGRDIMNNFLHIFRKWNSANAKEKGEVFTPDHIAFLMYNLAHCSKNNTILDPTCGSGTFLICSMCEMLKEAQTDEERNNIIQNQLLGIEINTFNSTLAGINMMLHGDGSSNIYNMDCFTQLTKLKNLYDRVLMNPPFSVRDKELKFVYQTLLCMKENGYLSTILPKSCVKGTDKENVDYLKNIFDIAQLESVVSLPNDLFGRNAGVATCICTFKRTSIGNSQETVLIDCSDDGFIMKSGERIDINNGWTGKVKKICKILTNDSSINNKEAVRKKLLPTDELLFERYSSNRTELVDQEVYEKYIRENISAKILCGFDLNVNNNSFSQLNTNEQRKYKKFNINEIIYKLQKGDSKSIDRKVENKFPQIGVPIITAKKDNNGVMGKTNEYKTIFNNKICIICGGDGGGGKTFYCDFEFCASNFVMICDIKDEIKKKNKIDDFAMFYIAINISERLFKTIGHGRTISEVPEISITLPVDKNDNIDFNFMSNYIKNLPFSNYLG